MCALCMCAWTNVYAHIYTFACVYVHDIFITIWIWIIYVKSWGFLTSRHSDERVITWKPSVSRTLAEVLTTALAPVLKSSGQFLIGTFLAQVGGHAEMDYTRWVTPGINLPLWGWGAWRKEWATVSLATAHTVFLLPWINRGKSLSLSLKHISNNTATELNELWR
jgi:hypothetical protein